MPRQPVVALLAGSFIVFTVGLIGLFAVHNEISKDMIIAGMVGYFLFMFYIMWASGRTATREAEAEWRATRIEYPEEPQAQAPVAEPRQDKNLANHGAIVRTSGEEGRLTYIEFADGYSIGTPPKEEDQEKRDRDRYEAVKV